MTERAHRERRSPWARGSVPVAVVLALAAIMFSVSARQAQAGTRQSGDLSDLAAVASQRVQKQSARVDSLRAQVDALAAQASAGSPIGTVSAGYLVAGGAVPVTGPGLVVELDDAPAGPVPDGVSPDVLVVHPQDLQSVMNALWAGGAEAMGLQDQRVVSTSAFRCVGNVLRLHGRVYSPPYTVRAVGDPTALRAALDASPAVRAYVRDSTRVGLGWDVAVQDVLELPAYSSTGLSYAKVPDGVEVLPGLDEPTPSGSAG